MALSYRGRGLFYFGPLPTSLFQKHVTSLSIVDFLNLTSVDLLQPFKTSNNLGFHIVQLKVSVSAFQKFITCLGFGVFEMLGLFQVPFQVRGRHVEMTNRIEC